MTQRLIFIGDFSSLSLFLSRGVASNGVESILFSNGDGWKGIPHQNTLYKNSNNPLKSAWHQIQGARSLESEITSNDTIVLSTEFIFNRWIDAILLSQLMQKSGRVVLLHAGCSDGFHQIYKSELLCKNCKQYDLEGQQCAFQNSRWPGLASVISNVDLVIPFTEIYVESAKMFGTTAANVTAPLNFPIDFDYIHSLTNKKNEHHKVIHGQNRQGFKGTAYLKEIMANDIDIKELISLLPRMSFTDFIDKLDTADIILDQLFANGYGMTGALSLAMGTSVAYGYTEKHPKPGFDGPGCVPIHITGNKQTDAPVLFQSLRDHLINLPSRSDVIDFARQRHCHKMIGNAFLNILS